MGFQGVHSFITIKICTFLIVPICYNTGQIYSRILIFAFYNDRENRENNHTRKFTVLQLSHHLNAAFSHVVKLPSRPPLEYFFRPPSKTQPHKDQPRFSLRLSYQCHDQQHPNTCQHPIQGLLLLFSRSRVLFT